MPETEKNEKWTLMFYFAGDNSLASEVVSQLKALKNAGYHKDVNVVAYFDPRVSETPAHIFDVNAFRKLEKAKSKRGATKIGFRANDPFVRNLLLDRLWGIEEGRDGIPIREMIQEIALKPEITYDLPSPPATPLSKDSNNNANNNAIEATRDSGPTASLKSFLKFCATEERYKAEHYMLFILGHGLVVGDDIFLFDEHAAKHSVTLIDLRKALEYFKGKLPAGAAFELVGFHSCSMSSVEVAFELKDTANYMLASQGPAFVGSWPYTQILIRVFNDVKRGSLKNAEDIKKMLGRICNYVFRNSADFLLGGYSFDIQLCSLSSQGMTTIEAPINKLSTALVEGLTDEMGKACILLAHLESQSYWNENYTDLYDFCFCLSRYCEKFSGLVKESSQIDKLQTVCDEVREALKKNPDSPIMFREFAGPESQYSHGFSIFFPWTRPSKDRAIMIEYEKYKFEATGWIKFLDAYWGHQEEGEVTGTMRAPHKGKEEKDTLAKTVRSNKYNDLIEDISSIMFDADGPLNTSGTLADTDKPHPRSPMGDECNCSSIKNFPRDTRKRSEKSKGAAKQGFLVSNQTNLKSMEQEP